MAPPMDLVGPYYDERRNMFIDIFEVKEIEKMGKNRFATFMRSLAGVIVNLESTS